MGVLLALLPALLAARGADAVSVRSSESPICGDFKFNWAGELRCLREALESCQDDRELLIDALRNDTPDTKLVTNKASTSSTGSGKQAISSAEIRTERGQRSLNIDAYYEQRRRAQNVQRTRQVHYDQRPWTRVTPLLPIPQSLQNDQDSSTTTSTSWRPTATTTTTTTPPPTAVPIDVAWLLNNVSMKIEKRLSDQRALFEMELKVLLGELETRLASECNDQIRATDTDVVKLKRRVNLLAARKEKFNGYEYMYMDKRESWYEAQEVCVSWGGNLASVHTSDENNFIADLVPADTAWISLNDVQLEKAFVNTDHTVTSFRAWKKGQPDNANHNENCVEVNQKGEWSDLFCLVTRPFVCKRKLKVKATTRL